MVDTSLAETLLRLLAGDVIFLTPDPFYNCEQDCESRPLPWADHSSPFHSPNS